MKIEAFLEQKVNQTCSKNEKIRPKSAYFSRLQHKKQQSFEQMKQYSTGLFAQVNNQLIPNYEQKYQPTINCLNKDPEPCSSGMKWRVPKTKLTPPEPKISTRATLHKRHRKNERASFQSRLQKIEKQSIKQIKFPSQKVLLSKQKAIPVICKQKQNYVIQICRIIKNNEEIFHQQNSRQHKAFEQSQVKKYRQFQSQKQNKNPNVTFNYDGSIIPISSNKKLNHNQIIQCVGRQIEANTAQTPNSLHETSKRSMKQKSFPESPFQIHPKLDEVGPQYVQIFQKIPWHQNVTVVNQQNKGKIAKKSSSNHRNLRKMERCRANTLNMNSECPDLRSIVKVENHQIYNDFLIAKPIRIKSCNIDMSKEVIQILDNSHLIKNIKQVAKNQGKTKKKVKFSKQQQKSKFLIAQNLSQTFQEFIQSSNYGKRQNKPQNAQNSLKSKTILSKPIKQILKKYQGQKKFLNQVRKKTSNKTQINTNQ